MNRLAWTLWCVLLWWCAALWLARGTVAEDVHTKGIDHLLDVLNFRRLHSRIKEGKWRSYGVEIEDNATPCIADVSVYLEALRRGAAWADMLYDATGRYSSQFTFGSDHWLGSKKLCLELDEVVRKRSSVEGGMEVERPPGHQEAEDAKSMASTSALTSAERMRESAADQFGRHVAKREDGSRAADRSEERGGAAPGRPTAVGMVPPFRLRFHVATVEVELPPNLSPKPRPVRIGVCMPRSCSPSTISSLISLSAADRDGLTLAVPKGTNIHRGRSVKVLRVRPVPGDYDWLKDPKAYVIGGATIFVVILMVLAEACELYHKYFRGRVDEEYVMSKMKDAEVGRNNNDGETMNLRKYQMAKIDDTPGLASRLLLCFSVRRNGWKILCGAESNGKDGEKNLDCIHGLRVFSMGWVILVHTYLMVFGIAENKKLRSVTERNIAFQTVTNATFSVDTFFLISGILVAYLYFRAKPREKKVAKEAAHHCEGTLETKPTTSKMRIAACPKKAGAAFATDFLVFFKLLGYRFLRLTPPYLWTIGIAEVGMRYTLNLSVFEPRIADGVTCAKYWWRNVMYINSLYPRDEMCMIWSWYMANDTQFYVIGILLLLISVRYFRFATIAGVIFLVSSWITTAVISIHYGYHVSIQDPFALFDELYDKPWLRLGPYMVGMVTGWLLYKTAQDIRMPKVAVLVGWLLSLSCMAFLVYGVALVGDRFGPTEAVGLGLIGSAIYTSLGHTAWAAAVAWIVITCSTGHGGWISGILSWSALRPFSRLTYCAFLIHPLVMMLTGFRMQGPLHLQNAVVVIISLGYMLTSYAAAFFISICFEAPAVSLLKMAFHTPKSKTIRKPTVTDDGANGNDCKLFKK